MKLRQDFQQVYNNVNWLQLHILPVIIIDPSTGHKNASSLVSVLFNMAGVDANLQRNQ